MRRNVMRRGVVGGLTSLLLFGGCGNGGAVTRDNGGGGFILPPIMNDNSPSSNGGNGDGNLNDNIDSQDGIKGIEAGRYLGLGRMECTSTKNGNYNSDATFFHYGYSDNGFLISQNGLPEIRDSGEIREGYEFSEEDEAGNYFLRVTSVDIDNEKGDVYVRWEGSSSGFNNIRESLKAEEIFKNIIPGILDYSVSTHYTGVGNVETDYTACEQSFSIDED